MPWHRPLLRKLHLLGHFTGDAAAQRGGYLGGGCVLAVGARRRRDDPRRRRAQVSRTGRPPFKRGRLLQVRPILLEAGRSVHGLLSASRAEEGHPIVLATAVCVEPLGRVVAYKVETQATRLQAPAVGPPAAVIDVESVKRFADGANPAAEGGELVQGESVRAVGVSVPQDVGRLPPAHIYVQVAQGWLQLLAAQKARLVPVVFGEDTADRRLRQSGAGRRVDRSWLGQACELAAQRGDLSQRETTRVVGVKFLQHRLRLAERDVDAEFLEHRLQLFPVQSPRTVLVVLGKCSADRLLRDGRRHHRHGLDDAPRTPGPRLACEHSCRLGIFCRAALGSANRLAHFLLGLRRFVYLPNRIEKRSLREAPGVPKVLREGWQGLVLPGGGPQLAVRLNQRDLLLNAFSDLPCFDLRRAAL
mmetsp:Transcript_22323/g.72136  ORF Transcript_22323/g.72136 Transcript_22323/m.72136 type:complete len:417 (-) Transcript_22323:100-1350(-)